MKKSTVKRLTSLAISICLIVGILTIGSISTMAAGGKLVYAGGGEYFTDTSVKTQKQSDAWVYISKTAKDSTTDHSLHEDEFLVTLVAKTKEKVDTIGMVADSQVSLVMDTSTSMYFFCAECGQNVCNTSGGVVRNKHSRTCKYYNSSSTAGQKSNAAYNFESRMDRTKTVSLAFLDGYAASSQNTTAHRYVSIVNFNTTATYFQPNSAQPTNAWLDVNTDNTGGAANLAAMKKYITDLPSTLPSGTPATNPDAGLSVANSLLRDSRFNPYISVENKSLILYTDGTPNRYVNASAAVMSTQGTSPARPNPHPYPATSNVVTNTTKYNPSTPTVIPPRYTSPSAKATAMKNAGISVFTVAYGGDADYTASGDDNADWAYDVKWMESLASTPADAYVADGQTSLDDMIRSFAEICDQIVWSDVAPYIITDPMGPYYIWSTSNTLNQGSAAGQTFAQNSFVWDLKKTPAPTKDADGWYTYTYTYKVTFDANAAWAAGYYKAFDASQGAPLNNTTTLTYVKRIDNNVVSDVQTVEFYLPRAVFVGGSTLKMPLNWMRSTEVSDDSYIVPAGGTADAWTYQNAMQRTPLQYFEDSNVRAVANGKAANNTEYVYNYDSQAEGRPLIWDRGNYFPLYKDQNGDVSYEWASWEHWGRSGNITDGTDYSVRRFTAYFDVDSAMLSNSSSVLLAPEDELGAMSYLFPIDDNAFIFVNGQLAFWGGTDVIKGENQYGALLRDNFMTKAGIQVRDGVNSVFKNVYPHTDGWCIDLQENASAVNIKSLLVPGFNRVDIFVDDFWEGGGMNLLNLYANVATK